MNNIYVDELPKNCIECPFCKDIKVNGGMDRLLFCKAYKFNKWKLMKNINKCFNRCEIKNNFKPLSDRLAEERKKVVQKAKRLVVESTCYETEEEARNHLYDLSSSEVLEILDQIERGE